MAHHDVFLSYSSLDKPIADAACATLEAQGIRCWIAPRDITPGQDWSDAIIDAIGDCRVFVLILSAASNLSEQVKREVQNAVTEAKPILPVRIEEVELSKHMRYFIGTPHWLDALSRPLERHLLKMAETVKAMMAAADNKAGGTPPASAARLAVPTGFPWDEQRLKRIEAELRQFIGPFSPQIVQEASRTAQSYQGLCARLAEQILSQREQRAFLAKCVDLIPAVESSSSVSAISEGMVMSAEKTLASYIGPLARLLVKRAARDASDRDSFYQALSEHISSPKEKAEFLRKVAR